MPGFLALKIGSVGLWEDGDIIEAINVRRCHRVHAEMLCRADDQREGRYHKRGTLAEVYQEKTYQYRFQRILDVVERTDLVTGMVDLVSTTPNLAGEAINVTEYLQRRLAHPRHRIFGAAGAEVWYGGRIDHSALDDIWVEIEGRTGNLKADHEVWPFSDEELRHFLVLPTDDFADAAMDTMKAPVLGEPDAEGDATILKRRRSFVNWKPLFARGGVTRANVEDRGVRVDLRLGSPLVRSGIVGTKP